MWLLSPAPLEFAYAGVLRLEANIVQPLVEVARRMPASPPRQV